MQEMLGCSKTTYLTSHISHLREYLSYCTVPYHLLTFSSTTPSRDLAGASTELRQLEGKANYTWLSTPLRAPQSLSSIGLRRGGPGSPGEALPSHCGKDSESPGLLGEIFTCP
eukprot:748266-Hanusia_phi.AAC.1